MNPYDNQDEWVTIDEADYYAQWEAEEPGLFTESDDAEFDQGWDEAKEDNYTDVEADADTLASAGWGTDEDYGYFDDYSGEW